MSILNIFIYSFVLGVASNQLGGCIGFMNKSNSKRKMSKVTAFTAGITTAIICFELLIEAFSISNKLLVVIYTFLGSIAVKIIDIIIANVKNLNNKDSLVIVAAMSAHNITEGIAIGSAFAISKELGISLLFAIMVHNIPEGIIIGITNRKEGAKLRLVTIECIVIGIFLGIGAVIGKCIGNISIDNIAKSLAISAGAMLYILACQLIPGMYNEKNNTKIGIIYVVGFLVGCIICSG